MLISSTEKKDYKSFLFMAIIILLLIGIMLKPTLAINSARNGLSSWFNILLPSLFSFMILSDILLSSGYVDHFGRFLIPLTRLLFNLSGPAAFPILISSISGYPMGPRLASKLRKYGLITQGEANRLISFVATSGPIFILGSVGIGILNMYEINFLLLCPHYLSSLTIGLAFRFFQNRQKETFYLNEPYRYEKKKKPFLSHNQPLAIGKTLTNSVKNSINSILLVGGFIILYSVVIEILLELKIFLILL